MTAVGGIRYIDSSPGSSNGQDDVTPNSVSVNFSIISPNYNKSSFPTYDEELAKVEVIIQAVIIMTTVLGNSVVLWTLFEQRKKLTRMHLFILHLALADLFVAFFNTLPMMVWDITHVFLGGDALCRMVTYLQSVAIYASSYVLLATAVDRYFAICHPLSSHKWSNRRVHIMVVIAWFFSFLFSLPQVVIWGRRLDKGIYNCLARFEPQWTLQFYITWLTAVIYILPTLALTLFYGMICYVVWKRGRPTSNGFASNTRFRNRTFLSNRISSRAGQNQLNRGFSEDDVQGQGVNYNRGLSRAKIRSVALTLTVVVCYFVCWSPFFICQMWAAWDESAPFTGKQNLQSFLNFLDFHINV